LLPKIRASASGDGTQLSVGTAPDSEPNPGGGELAPIIEERGDRDARGVRARLKSTASELSTELVLLGNVRTLRDYGYGVCPDDAAPGWLWRDVKVARCFA
jgi:hypothetical protein